MSHMTKVVVVIVVVIAVVLIVVIVVVTVVVMCMSQTTLTVSPFCITHLQKQSIKCSCPGLAGASDLMLVH